MPSRLTINEQRANLIAQAMDTPEARSAMAQAMVEPIRRHLNYQGIGRQLLMVDELPEGAYAHYKREIRITIADAELTEEERILCEWLIFCSDYKWQLLVEGMRGKFDNSIEQLEV